MRPPTLRPILLAAFVLATAACEAGPGTETPAAPGTGSLDSRRPESDQVQKLAGVSHLPRPENGEALAASMRRHYPSRFIGVRPRTAVLVDIDIDASGIVKNVRVVDRSGMDGADHMRAVVQQKVPGTNQIVEREISSTYDPAFGPAAESALREVRFQPALRDAQRVPFTLRMTVEFTDPAART